VIRFSRYAGQVTLLVRGRSLETSMSTYLISQLKELENVEVRTNTEVVSLESDSRLRALMVSSGGAVTRLPADALFVCIGGEPRTQGAANVGLALDAAGYVRTGAELTSSAGALDAWPLSREPCHSKRTCQGCSPPAMSGVGRSSAARLPSARGPWWLHWFTSASLKSAVSDLDTSSTTGLPGRPRQRVPARRQSPSSLEWLRRSNSAL